MSKHTKGPWKLKDNGDFQIDAADGYSITSIPKDDDYGRPEEDRANAERIVACVNACDGIVDPWVIPELIHTIRLLAKTEKAMNHHGPFCILLDRLNGKKFGEAA